MHTRVTRQLDIRYPIVQGGMQWVGIAEMAAAVSNAGALGMLTALSQPSAHELAREIARTRTLTDRPFGVNLTILPTLSPPPYDEYAAAIIDSGIRVVETSGHHPGRFVDQFKPHGLRVIHKCTSIRHAIAAERAGADMVAIDGFECAGHPGERDVGGLVLIPLAAQALAIPVLASGGIADGRGLAAALALGAEGITMGTRFLVTQEAPVHICIKEALAAASENDTELILRSFQNTSRVFSNEIARAVVSRERGEPKLDFATLRPLVAGARGREALRSGELHGGIITAGQCLGLIDDIPTCQALIERMVAECRQRLAEASRHAAPMADRPASLSSTAA